ncbi:hypothetical protein F4677DRAFT_338934 [Hypoxylon crocopeplum]|nr:hypothetical protein F4677DRAFT_338934 [Hypoxylon crocopeplum]
MPPTFYQSTISRTLSCRFITILLQQSKIRGSLSPRGFFFPLPFAQYKRSSQDYSISLGLEALEPLRSSSAALFFPVSPSCLTPPEPVTPSRRTNLQYWSSPNNDSTYSTRSPVTLFSNFTKSDQYFFIPSSYSLPSLVTTKANTSNPVTYWAWKSIFGNSCFKCHRSFASRKRNSQVFFCAVREESTEVHAGLAGSIVTTPRLVCPAPRLRWTSRRFDDKNFTQEDCYLQCKLVCVAFQNASESIQSSCKRISIVLLINGLQCDTNQLPRTRADSIGVNLGEYGTRRSVSILNDGTGCVPTNSSTTINR